MITFDDNISQNNLQKYFKKDNITPKIKTAISVTNLRKLHSEDRQKYKRNISKKETSKQHRKIHLSRSLINKNYQRTKTINKKLDEDNYLLKIQNSQKSEYLNIAREKEIIYNSYFKLTQKYFQALSRIQEQKEQHETQKDLLCQQIKQLRKLVNKSSNKQIHHIFHVPIRDPPLSQSKIICQIDEDYQTSNIMRNIPSNLSMRETSLISNNNLSSLDIQSNSGSQISNPQSCNIKKSKEK